MYRAVRSFKDILDHPAARSWRDLIKSPGACAWFQVDSKCCPTNLRRGWRSRVLDRQRSLCSQDPPRVRDQILRVRVICQYLFYARYPGPLKRVSPFSRSSLFMWAHRNGFLRDTGTMWMIPETSAGSAGSCLAAWAEYRVSLVRHNHCSANLALLMFWARYLSNRDHEGMQHAVMLA